MTEENQQPQTEGEAGAPAEPTEQAEAQATEETGVQAEQVEETEKAPEVTDVVEVTPQQLADKAVEVALKATDAMIDAKMDEAKLRNALENCRVYASKKPKEEWARTILRFCTEAGVTGSILRSE